MLVRNIKEKGCSLKREEDIKMDFRTKVCALGFLKNGITT
jgi:hypothetical protein